MPSLRSSVRNTASSAVVSWRNRNRVVIPQILARKYLEDAELSLISNLSVGLPGMQPQVNTPAEQGDAPADAAERPAPPVPTPSREGLSADEVVRLVGEAPGGNVDSDVSQS